MTTILVPTDFSKNAKNALGYAVSLAKKEKAKVILLHAYNITYLSPDVPLEYLAEQLSATQVEAAKFLSVLCERVKINDKVPCEFLNLEGLAVEVILDTIKHKKPDLVVMGTKGASGIKEVLVGSNTARVIGQATCPVIAVPEKALFTSLSKIVFATDYHSSDIVVVKQLTEMAQIFKSEVELLHIADKSAKVELVESDMNNFRNKIESKIAYKKISYQVLYATDIEKKLEQYLRKEPVNLLAVSTRYRTFVERMFGKSITRKLAYHTKVPLMAFHYQQAPLVYI